MRRRVSIFDTSLYCCWLGVPGRETAGSPPNFWDGPRVDHLIAETAKSGSTIILPLATVIEAGNHIAQSQHERFKHASKLCGHLKEALQGETPWVTFTDQSSFWTEEHLLKIVEEWPVLAEARMSFGDATIKRVADYYASAGFDVTILTADEQLRAYEPAKPSAFPRRSR